MLSPSRSNFLNSFHVDNLKDGQILDKILFSVCGPGFKLNPGTISNILPLIEESVQESFVCGRKCKDVAKCIGYIYDFQQKTCSFFTDGTGLEIEVNTEVDTAVDTAGSTAMGSVGNGDLGGAADVSADQDEEVGSDQSEGGTGNDVVYTTKVQCLIVPSTDVTEETPANVATTTTATTTTAATTTTTATTTTAATTTTTTTITTTATSTTSITTTTATTTTAATISTTTTSSTTTTITTTTTTTSTTTTTVRKSRCK